MTTIRQIPIAVPPISEQREIIDNVEEQLSRFENTSKYVDFDLKRATRLRQSILKQAFEGKLVPQDPKDEPAGVMLERLRAGNSAVSEDDGKASGSRRGARKQKSFFQKGEAVQ